MKNRNQALDFLTEVLFRILKINAFEKRDYTPLERSKFFVVLLGHLADSELFVMNFTIFRSNFTKLRISHCQMTSGFQPNFRSARMVLRSRSALPLTFFVQNSTLVCGR